MYKLINYTNNNISINVRYDEKNHTIWLTQNEIALVFGTTKSNITMHIKNVVKTSSGSKCDLPPEPIEDFVNNQKTKLYNLSMIEAISERSKSISGSEFIMWANELLSQNTNNQLTNISPSQAINYEIVTFNDGDFSINVSVSPKEETVWLTVSDIASIFERSEKTIYAHIQKIFAENELDRKSNSQKTRIPFSDKLIEVYNFEVLLSVGYKVTSDRGTKFRIWASKVLKQYSIKGYALNPNRIAVSDENYLELKDKVSDMQSILLKDNKRLDNVEQKLNEHDKTINNALGKDDIFKGMILFENEYYIGYSFIKQLILNAKERIILVDGYMELSVLDLFIEVDKNLPIKIITYPQARLTNKEINKFSETHNLTYIRDNLLHGRYLIIDNDIYLLDGSIKDIGNKRTAIIKTDSISIDELLNNYN